MMRRRARLIVATGYLVGGPLAVDGLETITINLETFT